MEIVTKDITHVNGQYQVPLPFAGEERPPVNLGVAIAQTNSLEKQLNKKPELKQSYHRVINDYVDKCFIERVDTSTNSGHYLPHHIVLKESKTTPVRLVFNASSKHAGGLSLNDCLLTGPSLVNLLYDQLLNF